MGLRNRIMLLVALGLLIATAPLGLMGLGMVRAATDRILEERLTMARTTADHLSRELANGWQQLDRLSMSAAPRATLGQPEAIGSEDLFSGGIAFVDRRGRIVAGRLSGGPPTLADAMPAIMDAWRTGVPQTTVTFDRSGAPLAIFVVPLNAPDGAIGAVAGAIDLTKPTLLTFINGMAMGTTGHAAIVSRDGQVLASTEPAQVSTRNEHPEFFRRLIDGGNALVAPADAEGSPVPQTHIMAFAPLTSAPWGVGIGQSADEAFGPINRLRDRIILFESLVLMAALLFAWLDTTAVVRPLGVLRRGAERIAEGDLAHPVEVQRSDEIGALAQAFEAMRVRLLQSLEENARLQERLRSVAMVEERERLAREMHDSVGQVLGYVNTKAQAVRALLETGRTEVAAAQLSQLERAAREVYADLREAILNLRTSTGADQRLLPALDAYVRRFTELSGVATDLVVDGEESCDFSPTSEAHLLRIVQEALTNVRKHAGARTARVRFATRNGATVVVVEDDGKGITPSPEQGQTLGFGLQTMRERAAAIGATMEVRPRPEGGTAVEVVIPKEAA